MSSRCGVVTAHPTRLEVPTLQFVEGSDARGVRAHDVVLANVEIRHAVGVRRGRQQQVVVGLTGVGALGALFDLDEPGVDRARASATAPLESRVEVVRGASWNWSRAKVVHLVAGAEKRRAQLVLAPAPASSASLRERS